MVGKWKGLYQVKLKGVYVIKKRKGSKDPIGTYMKFTKKKMIWETA